jgi:anti-sigma B factor antagonist
MLSLMASTHRLRPAAEAGCPEPSELLSITISRDGDAAVVAASGEIDLYTAPLLASALHDVIDDSGIELVVVDLTDVTFMASSGLTVLLSALDHAQRQRCELRLAGGGRPVRRPLEATGLDGHFEYVASAADAVKQHSLGRFSVAIKARTAQSPGTP